MDIFNFFHVYICNIAGKNGNDKNGPSKDEMLTAHIPHAHPSDTDSNNVTQSSSSASTSGEELPLDPQRSSEEPAPVNTDLETATPVERANALATNEHLDDSHKTNSDSSTLEAVNSDGISLATSADENIDVSSIQSHVDETELLKAQVPSLNPGSLKKV